ncbi:hypothetical protein [Intestinibacillus sp. Marseille-P6563]|uniref:hypothetical protein n=1 Tax=Intestinibacillus sp. Marseille-P6563 TaxID=2364792 RepID=UPI000F067A87|nr:hypothetical protein [Intestinibacillus sp. Marseille-P6563]
MDKTFRIVAIDDNPDTLDPVLHAVKQMLNLDGVKIEYKILSKQSEVDSLKNYSCDIVMFDCALSGEDYNFQNYEESRFGFTLLKRYRENNRRTKIIFYSGSFNFDGEGNFDLSALDFVQIINELKIFAITNREVPRLSKAIKSAIEELDTVLVSMEDLICNYGENGVFYIEGKSISANQLLQELRLGTAVGEKFREEIYSTIISYFMKFGGEQ